MGRKIKRKKKRENGFYYHVLIVNVKKIEKKKELHLDYLREKSNLGK